MQNTITVQHNNAQLTFKVTKKANKPFSNDFTQLTAKIVQYEGVDEVLAHVQCTAKSREPGRTYAVCYSLQGAMMACITTN